MASASSPQDIATAIAEAARGFGAEASSDDVAVVALRVGLG